MYEIPREEPVLGVSVPARQLYRGNLPLTLVPLSLDLGGQRVDERCHLQGRPPGGSVSEMIWVDMHGGN